MKREKEEYMPQMLHAWLKHQNIWRQIRYGLIGPWGRHGYWRVVLLMKVFGVAVFCLMAAGCLLPLLTKCSHYKEAASTSLENALNMHEGDARFELVSHNVRDWMIPSLSLKGNERTFFKEISLKGIEGKASVVAGLLGSWRPYFLSIDSIDMLAQTDTHPDVWRYQSLFGCFWVRNWSVQSLNLRWTRNERCCWLEDASCEASYQEGRWLLHLKGGGLHSEMFPNCQLIDARVVLAPGETIEIESCRLLVHPELAEANAPGVSVDLQGKISWEKGSAPHFDIRMQGRDIVLQSFISPRLAQFVRGMFAAEGSMKGEFRSPDDWVGQFQLKNQGDVEIVNVPLLLKLDEILVRNTFRSLICPDVSFEAVYSSRTRSWKARSIRARSHGDDNVEIQGELASHRMSDAEWKSFCMRFPEAIEQKSETESATQLYFTSGTRYVGTTSDDSGLLTRNVPLYEGEITLSFARESLRAVDAVLPEAMETRTEGERIVVVLPVNCIASEISKKESKELQINWIRSRVVSGDGEESAERAEAGDEADPSNSSDSDQPAEDSEESVSRTESGTGDSNMEIHDSHVEPEGSAESEVGKSQADSGDGDDDVNEQ